MGNEIVARAAIAAGAELYFGYPITPSSEIMETWAKLVPKYKLGFLQTEDEMAAGFAAIGAVLAGKKAFCATSGPGNVLMQDPLSMAEAMRLPVVVVIKQRGGPSTGSVIYGQQELNLTTFGGNSEGYRIVYAPASLQEVYDYTIKCFNTAWTYKFPTLLLSDGYLGKMIGKVELYQPQRLAKATSYLSKGYINLRNCFDLEEEVYKVNIDLKRAFDKIAPKIVESESYKTQDADILVGAWGIVSEAARVAVDKLRAQKIKVGLFRPITIHPFDQKNLLKASQKIKKILVVESAANQLMRLIKENLYRKNIPLSHYARPALGITPQEIIDSVIKIYKK